MGQEGHWIISLHKPLLNWGCLLPAGRLLETISEVVEGRNQQWEWCLEGRGEAETDLVGKRWGRRRGLRGLVISNEKGGNPASQ